MNIVNWKEKAWKQIKKIGDRKIKERIMSSVQNLATFPDCVNIKALANHQYPYRLRVGDYRVFFSTTNDEITIIYIEEVKNAMNVHTNYQIIEHNGQPAFVLVPWEDFNIVRPYLEQRETLKTAIPHAVVEANVLHNVPIIKAWREHLGMTQAEVAAKIGVKQPSFARIESGTTKPRHSTMIKLSNVFGVIPSLLEEL